MKSKIAHKGQKVVIIGSGIGGLSAGILLAGLGFEVTVVEKNRQPGGLMRSYTRQGVALNVGIHYLGALARGQVLNRLLAFMGVLDDLPLERMGRDGIVDRYHLPSELVKGGTFDMPEGLAAYESNLRTAFPQDGEHITALMNPLHQAARAIDSLAFLFSDENFFALLAQSEPLGDILTRWGCSPGLRAVLGTPAAWIGVPLSACPVFYHHMILASYLLSAWRLKAHGTQLADVFASRFMALSGSIVTGEAVEAITVKDRAATGVKLAGGRDIAADIIIGAVHPEVALNLLPSAAVKPSYRKRIQRIENTHGISGVHALVDAKAHPELPYNVFDIQSNGLGDISDMTFYQMRHSGQEDLTLLSILFDGQIQRWHQWDQTRTGKRGPDYLAAKQKEAKKRLHQAEQWFGALPGARVLDVFTPLTFRDWVNTPQGSAYGVMRSARQLLSTALLSRTPVNGLYLAGQSVMAPGLLGTIIGSLVTLKFILGRDGFEKAFADLKG